MSYTPTGWTDGDLITSQKLNKLEQGLADVSEDSGYDLIITADISYGHDSPYNFQVVQGSIEDCEDKIKLDEGFRIVNGLLVIVESVPQKSGGEYVVEYCPIVMWNTDSRQISFLWENSLYEVSYNENYEITSDEK